MKTNLTSGKEHEEEQTIHTMELNELLVFYEINLTYPAVEMRSKKMYNLGAV